MPEFLVDTCIWSEVLRRKKPNPVISEHLAKMLRNLQAVLIGPVIHEIEGTALVSARCPHYDAGL